MARVIRQRGCKQEWERAGFRVTGNLEQSLCQEEYSLYNSTK